MKFSNLNRLWQLNSNINYFKIISLILKMNKDNSFPFFFLCVCCLQLYVKDELVSEKLIKIGLFTRDLPIQLTNK